MFSVLKAMDQSHVALVCFMLRASGFEVFRCDRSLSLGVKIESFGKVLKCAGNDDSVTIKAEDSGANEMGFLFESKKTDRISDFSLKLMDIDQERLGIPETDYASSVEMPSQEFRRIMNDLSVLGDTVTIKVNKEGASFNVEGDMGSGNICLHKSSSVDKPSEAVKITMSEPVKSTFSLKYLNSFAKAAALSDSVILSMSEEIPVCIEFNIANNLGYLRYYLAPKIEDDENTGS